MEEDSIFLIRDSGGLEKVQRNLMKMRIFYR